MTLWNSAQGSAEFFVISACVWLQPFKTMARHSTKLSAAVVLLVVACLAFQAITQAFVATSLNRRDALQAAGFAAATLGSQAVWADAQGEPIFCLTRYGPQILQLKDAVDKGDMEAVLKKEPAFKLLESYWRRNDPALFEKYSTMSSELLTAADEGKKDVVKKLFAEYTSDPVFEALKTPIKRRKNTMTMSSYGAGKAINYEWATSEFVCSGSGRAVGRSWKEAHGSTFLAFRAKNWSAFAGGFLSVFFDKSIADYLANVTCKCIGIHTHTW